ncbi:unnamed protein product [Closterium sp. Naga37s-1]|nr:unnamed protein product [Closterium sp. Naga37s-1]
MTYMEKLQACTVTECSLLSAGQRVVICGTANLDEGEHVVGGAGQEDGGIEETGVEEGGSEEEEGEGSEAEESEGQGSGEDGEDVE